jgi:hypothetical protein
VCREGEEEEADGRAGEGEDGERAQGEKGRRVALGACLVAVPMRHATKHSRQVHGTDGLPCMQPSWVHPMTLLCMLCYYTDPVGVQGPRRVNPREINAKITTTHHTTCREQAVSTPCKRL